MNSQLDNARRARAFAAQLSYGDPSARMKMVGVTGTNGKTTTVRIIQALLQYAGLQARSLGTIGSPLTTLGEPELAQTLATFCGEGVEAVAMEVSSHGLDQRRVDGVHFDVSAFSNLTQDHLDYHRDMDEYFDAKKRLFFDLDSDVSVINIADEHGAALVALIESRLPDRTLITVGSPHADLFAENIVERAAHTSFDLYHHDTRYPITLPLVGYHNVSNALLAAGCALGLGIDMDTVAAALDAVPQVPGRLQRVDSDAPVHAFVDYAHTPDALKRALDALRDITEGELWVVFGCGGDRDQTKRPLMGAIAAQGADHIIVTTDNPRNEKPEEIVAQIVAGIDESEHPRCHVEIDRARAIEYAAGGARAGDTILIAGKGHETIQIFADRVIDFDDVRVARKALARTTAPEE